MNTALKRLLATSIAGGWTLMTFTAVNAQDVEIFIGNNNPGNNAKPNILFILDDSGSMDGEVITQNNYDPTIDYDGDCRDDRFYWSQSSSPPDCDTDRY